MKIINKILFIPLFLVSLFVIWACSKEMSFLSDTNTTLLTNVRWGTVLIVADMLALISFYYIFKDHLSNRIFILACHLLIWVFLILSIYLANEIMFPPSGGSGRFGDPQIRIVCNFLRHLFKIIAFSLNITFFLSILIRNKGNSDKED